MIDKIKASSIFNVISLIILLGTIFIYSLFVQTKDSIEKINIDSNINYIDNITNNISKIIINSSFQDIHISLKNDKKLRKKIEQNIEVFITNKYRYIYVLDKEDKNKDIFRFLLDGAKNNEDKSEFLEEYIPSNIEIINKIYKTKKATYFKHNDIKNLWITYLKPIIVNNEVQAIIVVDFSLETHSEIVKFLENLDNSLVTILFFSFIIFIVILGFSYLDKKREKVKIDLFNKLKYTNKALKEKTKEANSKSKKILEFNKTLEQKVEDELAKNREKDKHMLEQSRLAQMGEMLSMIAHQWRQPLSAISATSNAINLKAKLNKLDEESAISLSQNISDYSQHLSLTINDFRDFFKSNKQKEETTFTEIIKSVLGIIELSINTKNIKLVKKLNCKDCFYSYPNELKQVLLNLLKNAEDILVEKSIENPYIEINTYTRNKKFILEVKDNGGGIPEKYLSKIFDPYFSTKTKKDGTGLGLYMSKTIINEHCKGILDVSNSNDGAVFTITLKNIKDS